MKKLLLSLILTSAVTVSFAQVQTVINENFNALNMGNLATDVTGATPGQNGWYIANGTPADYQIATVDAAHGKSLTITSGPGAPIGTANANNRFAWTEFTTTPTATNKVVKVEFEIFTGPATGVGRSSSSLYDASGIVGIAYDYASKTFKGLLRLTPTGGATAGVPAFFTANLGTQVFPANTWVKVFYYYNQTDGSFGFGYPGGTYTFGLAQVGTTYTLSPNLVATEHDFYNVTTAGNTVANVNSFDNLLMTYSTLAQALSTQDVQAAQLALGIYPNPTSDFINIISEDKIKTITVFDMTGKIMDVKFADKKADVRNLQTGAYIISVETTKGKTTEKFIKK